jgi:hypothetical protein
MKLTIFFVLHFTSVIDLDQDSEHSREKSIIEPVREVFPL